jgi:hypothetical protein
MASVGSSSSAVATLTQLAQSQDVRAKTLAYAALGSLRLNLGAYENGYTYLQQAASSLDSSNLTASVHASILADLSIAQLILGHEQEGLRNLRHAQSLFLADSSFLALAQAIENEVRYLQAEKKSADAAQAQQRLQGLEQQWL